MTKRESPKRLAAIYLQDRYPHFVSPTEVGREVGNQLGKTGRHSSFGSPLCQKLLAAGLVTRNTQGHYAAVNNSIAEGVQ